MKLNYKRTALVGFAFMSISAFWQLYDTAIPRMLQYTFNIKEGPVGIVMALDNVLALFLLPFFGALSDKTKSRFGRRMPYIVCGTLAASLLMTALPMFDKAQRFPLFIVALGLLLVAMGTYRSPAVALMPDVTPKPLRSKGNAIINLMGTLGGLYTLVMIRFLVKSYEGTTRDDYLPVFIAVAALMIVAVAVLALTIRERKLVKEMEDINYGMPPEENQVAESADGAGTEKLQRPVFKSLVLILSSVFFWFMGYNAVTTAFSRYVTEQWGKGVGDASLCLMVATVGATLSFIPVGMLSSKFGRKRMIQFGVVLLAACFAFGATVQQFSISLYILFALVGCAWACINVNSYPMVVEISKGSNVGKYTGYYYTFSMAAQIVTPILSGYLIQHLGYGTLFPYAAVMVAVSFITITLSRHGDNKPQGKVDKLEALAGGE